MDYLKANAPFWKKEDGPDGANWVVRGTLTLSRWPVGIVIMTDYPIDLVDL